MVRMAESRVALAQIAASRDEAHQPKGAKGGAKVKGQGEDERRLIAVKQRWQITLTEALQALNVRVGDYLEVLVENGRITLVPVAVIPRDELYLMSPGWQRQLAEAADDEKNGRIHKAASVDELLAELDGEDDTAED